MKRRTLLGLAATTAVAGGLAGCVERLDSDGADPGAGTTGNRTSGSPTGDAGTTDSTTADTTTASGRTTTTDGTARSTSTTSETTTERRTTTEPGEPPATTSPGAPDPPGGPGDDPPEDDPVAPGVADRTVTENGECRGRDATAGSSASLSGDVLVVTGTVLSSSRCPTTVVLTDTSYEDGVYAIDYRIVPTGRICAHCLARFDYEIRVEFERPPEEVLVNGRSVGASGERIPGSGGQDG